MSLPRAAALLAMLTTSCQCNEDLGALDPSKATETAPEVFRVKMETTVGDVVVECKREWAPNGADRFYNLVKMGFFDDTAFFRVVTKPTPFVVQFGIHGKPAVAKRWSSANIDKDEPTQSNKRGTLTFAMGGSPDTRSTQLFFNLANNGRLDGMGFAPICAVMGDGMQVIDKINDQYAETPEQGEIQSKGNEYLRSKFPKLDYIKSAKLEDEPAPAASSR